MYIVVEESEFSEFRFKIKALNLKIKELGQFYAVIFLI